MEELKSTDKKILIIDDDQGDLMLIHSALRTAGYRNIERLSSGEGVAEIAARLKPDLIISDILMPKINGIMTGNALKQSEATRRIPVVYVSGVLDEDHTETGEDGVIVGKSITYKALVGVVNNFFRESIIL